ncbi:hypothetical protein CMQ_4624 [Grosmannia clavigera kw1407]|uniref:DNA2/NAM7 helicase-like C-terminal domain-containing protein n=1 Tax=Grosmannia clavigera (strain kw1407 / UAMH 11150) TaxID=655863 RepID=F0XTY1_GROCL|nr:uncharacterized protein CMQ_4624 [Grosmannia clavigera kw1407]EFW98772.1 hypothetical protein CMQ_4624 [Grosmannia clavigera kw1407]
MKEDSGAVKPTNFHRIVVRFPRYDIKIVVDEPGNAMRAKFPTAPKIWRMRIPAYRLVVQLRMCRGMFGHITDVPNRRCPNQTKIALDFIRDFIEANKVDARSVRVLTPYAANVYLINSMVRLPEYSSLSSMEPATTVDSFQGLEADIAVVVRASGSTPAPAGVDPDARLLPLTSLDAGTPPSSPVAESTG